MPAARIAKVHLGAASLATDLDSDVVHGRNSISIGGNAAPCYLLPRASRRHRSCRRQIVAHGSRESDACRFPTAHRGARSSRVSSTPFEAPASTTSLSSPDHEPAVIIDAAAHERGFTRVVVNADYEVRSTVVSAHRPSRDRSGSGRRAAPDARGRAARFSRDRPRRAGTGSWMRRVRRSCAPDQRRSARASGRSSRASCSRRFCAAPAERDWKPIVAKSRIGRRGDVPCRRRGRVYRHLTRLLSTTRLI